MTADQRDWTRRQFVSAAGLALVAASGPLVPVARAVGRLALPAPDSTVRAFVSRPDLTPPAIATSMPPASVQPGYMFTAPFSGPGQHGPLIGDDGGDPVWFLPVSGPTAMNFRVQTYRGDDVLTWWEGQVDDGGYGGGRGLIANHAYEQIAVVKAGHGLQSDLHEFVLTSRGTALIAIYSESAGDLTAYGGPADGRIVEGVIQEIDVVSGRVLFEWHSLDHVGLDESYRTYPTDPGQFDYFHLNSIGVDTDGNLLVSGRHTSTVYKLDRRTGAVIWRLGGKRNDFRLGTGAAFEFQHDARGHADGTLTLFDNGAWGPDGIAEAASRPLRLALDTTAMTATLIQSFVLPQPRLAVAMGDVQLLPDGGVIVGWGTAGPFSEFGPDGSLRYDANFAGGGYSYRAFRYPWVGRPLTLPSVATTHDQPGQTTVHVSWNGATDVASWKVTAGPRANALRSVRTVARTGFETAITVPALTGWVAVEALDARGKTLAGSTPRRA